MQMKWFIHEMRDDDHMCWTPTYDDVRLCIIMHSEDDEFCIFAL